MCFLSIFEDIGVIPMLMFLALLLRLLRQFFFRKNDDDDKKLPVVVMVSEAESSDSDEFPTMHRVRRSRYVYGDYHPKLLYGISKKAINYCVMCVMYFAKSELYF